VNESEKVKYEKWAFIQEITPEDIAQAIEGSEALCHAIRLNQYTESADIIRTRIEAYAQRIAELRVFNEIKTPSIDDIQELEEFQLRQIERQQAALERQKVAIINKLALDNDELKLHETNIQLINALKKYVKTDVLLGSTDNSIYKDANALLESLGEL
jgi:PP-loop superfamily ATP-utilizing enzyme